MTDFELEIHDAIVKWYQEYEGNYFDNRPWNHLYEEPKQLAAQLYWQEMLS